MKVISTCQTQLYEGSSNDQQVIDKLMDMSNDAITVYRISADPIAAGASDQAISLTGYTPVKFLLVKSDKEITIKLATGGTPMSALKGLVLYGAISELLISNANASPANVEIVVGK